MDVKVRIPIKDGSSNGLVFRVLDPNPEVPDLKTLGGSKVDSAFHLSEVDQMSAKNA